MGTNPVTILGGLTTRDVDALAGEGGDALGRRILLIPLGSTEQHGPHLPLSTDTIIATAIAERTAAEIGPTLHIATAIAERTAAEIGLTVFVAPALPYGASGEHAGFAGTISIGTHALTAVLVELGRSTTRPGGGPFDHVVFVNGHGGNHTALQEAVATLTDEGRSAHGWWPRFGPSGPDDVAGHDAHAGWTETSLLLALRPDLVRVTLAEPGATAPLAELLPAMRLGGVAAVSANGVLGDPTGASGEAGNELLNELVAQLSAILCSLLP